MASAERKTATKIAYTDDFSSLNCERAMHLLLQRIAAHLAEEEQTSPVRRYFERETLGRDGSEPDTRLLIHSQINVIRELLERRADASGVSLLLYIEREYC